MRIIVVNICVLFLLHVLSVEAQETQFQLEIFLEGYQNLNHRTAAGECCNGRRDRNCGNEDCNNVFTFCTGPSGQASVDTGTCPYGMFSFTINNDDFDFPFSTASPSPTIVPGSPNPIIFQGSERLTGRVQVNIVVRNNNIELVDNFTREGPLTPSPMFTPRDVINGIRDQREIYLRYRVQCALNFYGSDCNVRCVPTDRSICDSDGNMVCKEGYQNPENGCLDCVSATGCDTGDLGSLGTGSNSNQTTALIPEVGSEQQGLSQGGVAGVVIAVLIIVALVGGGVAVGIVLWVHQPWSNGWYGVEEKFRKMNGRNDAISNPVYEQTEMDSSQNAEVSGPVRGVKYTPITNSGGAAENGHGGQVNLNMLTHSLDDDNPLYASSALERILSPRDGGGTRNANGILQEELARGMGNGHAQSNAGAAAAAGPQNNFAKIATLRESASLEHVLMSADVRDLTKPSKPQSSDGRPPPIPMKPKIQLPTRHNSIGSLPRGRGTTHDVTMTSFLVASQSLDNLLGKPENANVLNPYGDYGDKTLQRVVSGHSMNEVGEESNGKIVKDDQMFDNPDYECVTTDDGMESEQPKDIDYEDIDV